ncbi:MULTISPECIES: alpha/beta hydrolase [unclassified Moritella]|uniref:alpha/beta hydrolase n=1 Tax=unclassified Moritella TaxID=2637987 RepID=UPI0007953BF8|nr:MULTISPECIES: alpha/beta hydrolase [unclassified Moritella]KXO13399.1 putative esterase [Moritella sp. JT01]MCJ8351304.1 alpha/beta hydrolase [Moritella sp.]NQZ41294.1 alpha/beta hydrolase [Moritella sp.]
MNLFRGFKTSKDINEEYNAVLSVDNLGMYIEQDLTRSKETRDELKCFEDIPYGSSEDEILDVYPSSHMNSPVVVFIHGGYWKSLSSKDFSFVAKGLVEKGFTVVLTNYSLCPKVSIPEITKQNCSAIEWTYNNSHKFNGNNQKIFVCGHSAGGHQAAMLALCDWNDLDLPNDVIKGCIAISGLFDLSPLKFSWLQTEINLTEKIILEQSPLLEASLNSPSTMLIVGEYESIEFKRQSSDYADKLRDSGNDVQLYFSTGKNHFSVVQDLYQSDSELCSNIERFIKLNDSGAVGT